MLTASERRALKARAHKLEPVVRIGAKGLTGEVVAEIDRALKAHELIKVRAGTLERDERSSVVEEICGRTGAAQVQSVGKIFVLFRKNDEQA
ncbi:MAG TPA: ribosome assembly RNA-binding protein YhbY [Burkholderiales bacterium]|nr:ribosome assembly RNA-binding protein YhbY [Burkholderiales bacterium]